MEITHSLNESERYGYQIYRASDYLDSLDEATIVKVLYDKQPDIVKLKVRASSPSLFQKLSKIPFPFSIHNLVRRNVVDIKSDDMLYDLPVGVHVEQAGTTHENVLMDIVRRVLAASTAQHYESLFSYHTAEQYLENSVAYMQTFIKRLDAAVWILYNEGNAVGFFSGIFSADTFTGILYGILPEYRSKGFSNAIYHVMKKICAQRGLRYFVNDVESHNWGSVKSAQNIGMVSDEYFHITIYPFLSQLGETLMQGEKFVGLESILLELGPKWQEAATKGILVHNLQNAPYRYEVKRRVVGNKSILTIRIFTHQNVAHAIIY